MSWKIRPRSHVRKGRVLCGCSAAADRHGWHWQGQSAGDTGTHLTSQGFWVANLQVVCSRDFSEASAFGWLKFSDSPVWRSVSGFRQPWGSGSSMGTPVPDESPTRSWVTCPMLSAQHSSPCQVLCWPWLAKFIQKMERKHLLSWVIQIKETPSPKIWILSAKRLGRQVLCFYVLLRTLKMMSFPISVC